MVAAEYQIANLRERALQKQATRDRDAQRIREGAASPQQVRRENHVLGGVDLSSFRMVSIGKRRIGNS
jgi:hypothetical protein